MFIKEPNAEETGVWWREKGMRILTSFVYELTDLHYRLRGNLGLSPWDSPARPPGPSPPGNCRALTRGLRQVPQRPRTRTTALEELDNTPLRAVVAAHASAAVLINEVLSLITHQFATYNNKVSLNHTAVFKGIDMFLYLKDTVFPV